MTEPEPERHLHSVPDDGLSPFAGDYGEGKSYDEEAADSMAALGLALVLAFVIVVGIIVALALA